MSSKTATENGVIASYIFQELAKSRSAVLQHV